MTNLFMENFKSLVKLAKTEGVAKFAKMASNDAGQILCEECRFKIRIDLNQSGRLGSGSTVEDTPLAFNAQFIGVVSKASRFTLFPPTL